jgi:hypothetical protein
MGAIHSYDRQWAAQKLSGRQSKLLCCSVVASSACVSGANWRRASAMDGRDLGWKRRVHRSSRDNATLCRGARSNTGLPRPDAEVYTGTAPKRGGNKRHVDVREVMNGIMYVLSTGCQWRAIPKDLPPRSILWPNFTGSMPIEKTMGIVDVGAHHFPISRR